MNPAVRTTYTREIEVIKASEGRIRAVMSTEDIDRQGDIIRASGWELKNFLAHPVLLANHDYSSIQSQIGEWTNVQVRGKKLIGDAQYYIGQGNAQADWGFSLAEKGMAAFSVGFRPDWSAAVEIDGDAVFGSFEFNGQELLETSHVTIPANPAALQRMRGVKGLHPVLADIVNESLIEMDTPSVLALRLAPVTRAEDDQLTDLAARIIKELSKAPQIETDDQLNQLAVYCLRVGAGKISADLTSNIQTDDSIELPSVAQALVAALTTALQEARR